VPILANCLVSVDSSARAGSRCTVLVQRCVPARHPDSSWPPAGNPQLSARERGQMCQRSIDMHPASQATEVVRKVVR
jgi:hypothetical protein